MHIHVITFENKNMVNKTIRFQLNDKQKNIKGAFMFPLNIICDQYLIKILRRGVRIHRRLTENFVLG